MALYKVPIFYQPFIYSKKRLSKSSKLHCEICCCVCAQGISRASARQHLVQNDRGWLAHVHERKRSLHARPSTNQIYLSYLAGLLLVEARRVDTEMQDLVFVTAPKSEMNNFARSFMLHDLISYHVNTFITSVNKLGRRTTKRGAGIAFSALSYNLK